MKMDNSSLFAKHMEYIEASEQDKLSLEITPIINKLHLRPLQFPVEKNSWTERLTHFLFSPSPSLGLALGALVATLVFINVLQLENRPEFRSKGGMRVNFYFERNGIVGALKEEEGLLPGDKIGVSIIANQNSTAYWFVVNDKMQSLQSTEEILSSQIEIRNGQKTSFSESFELTQENDGESLVVMICEKQNTPANVASYLNEQLISGVLAAKNMQKEDCLLVGRKLRSRKELK